MVCSSVSVAACAVPTPYDAITIGLGPGERRALRGDRQAGELGVGAELRERLGRDVADDRVLAQACEIDLDDQLRAVGQEREHVLGRGDDVRGRLRRRHLSRAPCPATRRRHHRERGRFHASAWLSAAITRGMSWCEATDTRMWFGQTGEHRHRPHDHAHAQQLLVDRRRRLPVNLPASHHYEIVAPAGTHVDFGTVAPAFGQSGGGVEAYFAEP